MATTKPQELTRTLFMIFFVMGTMLASSYILLPFVGAGIWAVMIVVATWPLLVRLQARLGNRRGAAATIMTGVLLLTVVVPLLVLMGGVARNLDRIRGLPEAAASFTVPPPPESLARLPLVGPRLSDAWGEFAARDGEQLAASIRPYAAEAAQWVVRKAGGMTLLLVQMLLTIIIAAVLYVNGEAAARGLTQFARKLGGARGEGVVVLAGQTIRAVALGVIVTAVLQATLAGIGLFVAGVPFAVALTGVTLVLCIAQLGPILVLLPAVAWLYWSGETTWGTVLLVWSIAVIPLDNVVRPILIKRGAPLPLLLVFAGVIGGLVSLGMIGIFAGPLVLAVAHSLLKSWIADADEPGAAEAALPAGAGAGS